MERYWIVSTSKYYISATEKKNDEKNANEKFELFFKNEKWMQMYSFDSISL